MRGSSQAMAQRQRRRTEQMSELIWDNPIKSGGLQSIKSGPYMITKQGERYQASRLRSWENLGPAGTLEAAKKLCEQSR